MASVPISASWHRQWRRVRAAIRPADGVGALQVAHCGDGRAEVFSAYRPKFWHLDASSRSFALSLSKDAAGSGHNPGSRAYGLRWRLRSGRDLPRSSSWFAGLSPRNGRAPAAISVLGPFLPRHPPRREVPLIGVRGRITRDRSILDTPISGREPVSFSSRDRFFSEPGTAATGGRTAQRERP
jgi:hypothetical protein